MPRGYRFFIVALGLAALFIAFGLGMYVVELNYPEQQRYQEYKSGKGNEGTATLTVTRDLAGSIMKRTPCHNPNSESESDLCAQWKAANAAEDGAFWTKWGFGVAIVGSSFLLWQIILTREAVKDTGNATLAMQRQNELADQGQRPWIEIDLKFDFLSRMSDGGILVACKVMMKNIGSTPAYSAIVEHVLAPESRNPIFDFKIAAEAHPSEAWDEVAGEIVLPHGGTAEVQEIIYLYSTDPCHSFDDGVVPQFMITVYYKLPDGRAAQSSRWFVIERATPEAGRPSLIPWNVLNDEYEDGPMKVESYTYIRVT